jgi:membrane-bound lytic murein transglycosylase D
MTSGKVDEAAVNALYARLDADSQRFESGLQMAASGDMAGAQAEMKTAMDDLQASAATCASTPGCDGSRFASVYDRLLRRSLELSPVEGAVSTDVVADEPTRESSEDSPVIASLPAMQRTITLLNGRELADILVTNEAVKAGLEQWLTQYRPNLMTAYVNYQFMRYKMWPEYHKAGLPEALLFGMMAKESGGRVHAVSRSGASGPLQFMPATGLRFGLGSKDGFDQRFDPALSTRANAAYINEQLERLNGNLELVIAAYNGGEGRIGRLAARSGVSSFWDPKIYSALPTETRDYVPMVLAAAWLFLHPERYNLDFPSINAHPGRIKLVEPASLAELTVCLGNTGNMYDGWFRTLRNLNPSLDPQKKLAVGTELEAPVQLESAYARQCVSGRWAQLASELNAATTAMTPVRSAARNTASTGTYTVRKGDNLAAIARRSGCTSTREIAQLNGIRAPHYRIKAGQKLQMPSCSKR